MNINARRLFFDATILFINGHILFIDATILSIDGRHLFIDAKILFSNAQIMVINARILFIYEMIFVTKALVLSATGGIMRNRFCLNALLLLCLALSALAGWERTYGGSGIEYGSSIVQTFDDGYIIAGVIDPSIGMDSDIYLLRLNSFGDTIWTQAHGDYGEDRGKSVIQTSDSCFIVSAYHWSGGYSDIRLLKLDTLGDTIWVKTYDWFSPFNAYSLETASDGGFLLFGSYYNTITGSDDFHLIRLNSDGDTVWTNCYGDSSSEDYCYSGVQTSDGGYIIGGDSYPSGDSLPDIYLIKVNAFGDIIWERVYSDSSYFSCKSITRTLDNGFVITGSKATCDTGHYTNVYVAKFDEYGDTVWTRDYGGCYSEVGYSLVNCPDGGYIITGSTMSFSVGRCDVYILKIDSDGTELWSRNYGSIYDDIGYAIQRTSDEGYVIAGLTLTDSVNVDVFVIKTDSLGYTVIEENPPAARPEDIAICAYPNPFNSAVRISVGEGLRPSRVEVFDINGRLVEEIPVGATLCGRPLEGQAHGPAPTTREYIWQPEKSLGSGVYLIKINIDGNEISKRVVYLK